MEVVPKVLQGFWVPPSTTSFNMPSRTRPQLSKMAVGVTKAVQDWVAAALSPPVWHVTFSGSMTDNLVLSIQEQVRQGNTDAVLVKKINFLAAKGPVDIY